MTPFPLPVDPAFRKEVIVSWLEDVDDRLLRGDIEAASYSLNVATGLYLSLPPGNGSELIEKTILEARVKISKHP